MVGGRGKKEGSLLYNRATSSLRQPGSTIKVIGTYAAAIDGGQITLGTIYDDAPYTYSNGKEVVNSTGTYAGKTTIRNAIYDVDPNMLRVTLFTSGAVLDDFDLANSPEKVRSSFVEFRVVRSGERTMFEFDGAVGYYWLRFEKPVAV